MLDLNLLYDHERRYQGKVSLGFLLRAVVFVGCSGLILLAVRFIVGDVQERTAYRDHTLQWDRIRPIYEQKKNFEAASDQAREYRKEMGGWASSRMPTGDLLDHLQTLAPPSIQIVRIAYKDEIKETGKKRTGDEEKASSDRPGLVRQFCMQIAGRSRGTEARGQVEQLINRLQSYRTSSNAPPVFEYARLRSMMAPRGTVPGEVVDGMDFDIELGGAPRPLP